MRTIGEQIRTSLYEVLNDLEDAYENIDRDELLDELEEALQQHHSEHYELEQSPAGEAWQPLAERTIKKKGFDKILVEFDTMRASLTHHTAESVRRRSNENRISLLEFGTRDKKAAYHQDGTKRIPQREHVGMSRLFVDGEVDNVANFIIRGLKA